MTRQRRELRRNPRRLLAQTTILFRMRGMSAHGKLPMLACVATACMSVHTVSRKEFKNVTALWNAKIKILNPPFRTGSKAAGENSLISLTKFTSQFPVQKLEGINPILPVQKFEVINPISNSNDTIVDYSFRLPNGKTTSKCDLQEKLPVYFMSHPEYTPQFYIQLHNAVAACGTYNYMGARIPLPQNKLNVELFREKLKSYADNEIVQFIEFGFPLSVNEGAELNSTMRNHPSAFEYHADVDKFIHKELAAGGLSGPYFTCPFNDVTVSPLMTTEKKPSGRRI